MLMTLGMLSGLRHEGPFPFSRKARQKGRIIPHLLCRLFLLSIAAAMQTKQQQDLSFLTPGERSSDHSASDSVEAGQQHTSPLYLPAS